MKESVLNQLTRCPSCGMRYRPDVEGRPDGTACFKCEDLPETAYENDPKKRQIELPFDQHP